MANVPYTYGVTYQRSTKRYDPKGNLTYDYTTNVTYTAMRYRVSGKTSNQITWHRGFPWRDPSGYACSSVITSPELQNQVWMKSDGTKEVRSPLVWSVREGYTGPHFGGGKISWNDNLANRASTECMEKLRNSHVDLGTSAAEAKTTATHLIDSAVSLLQAYRAARRKNWRGVARSLGVAYNGKPKGKNTAAKWLEYQYAWRPLMGDIYGSYEQLLEGFRKKDQLVTARRVITEQSSSPERHVNGYKREGGSTLRVKCTIVAMVDRPTLLMLNQLGLVNPAAIAWEVVPFSFVVDWVIPVGDILGGITAPLGMRFIAGTISHSVLSHWSEKAPTSNGGYTLISGPATDDVRTTVRAYERRKLTGWPIAKWYYKSPFSTTHIISALALFRQLVR